MTADPWREVTAARLPWSGLTALAAVRDRAEVRVLREGETGWVRWPAGALDVVRCLWPARGVEFFLRRDGQWFRVGRRAPTADAPPIGDGQSIAAVLVPTRFVPAPPSRPDGPRMQLCAIRGGSPKPITALSCAIAELRHWADTATTAELGAVRAARSVERVVLLGTRLPAVAGGTRYWGKDVFVPAGFRPEPDLVPSAIRDTVGAAADELVFLDEDGVELIPRSAFEPLTRAGVRLAARTGSTSP